jgi:hypothetical protein
MTRQRSFLFELIAATAVACLAQAPSVPAQVERKQEVSRIEPKKPVLAPGHRVSIQPETPYRLAHNREFENTIARLDPGKLRPLVSGSWEAQIVTAAKKAGSLILQIKLDDPSGPRFFTLPTDEGDTLVARWSGVDAGRPEKAIWLWDTPFYTIFITDVNAAVLQPSELMRYCEDLFSSSHT